MNKKLSGIIFFVFVIGAHQNIAAKSLEDLLEDKKEQIVEKQTELEIVFNKKTREFNKTYEDACNYIVQQAISFEGLKEFLIKHKVEFIFYEESFFRGVRHFFVKIDNKVQVPITGNLDEEYRVLDTYVQTEKNGDYSPIKVHDFIAYREQYFKQKFEQLQCSEVLK